MSWFRSFSQPFCPVPCALFFFLLFVYLFVNGGHLGAYDAAMEYEVTKNLLRYGTFDLRDEQFDETTAARGRDGRLYSPHGLGQSIAMIPFYLVGDCVARFWPELPETRVHHFFISLLNPLMTAAASVILLLLQLELGFGRRTAVSVASIYGLLTIALPYAKLSFDVPLTAFLLLGAAYGGYRFRRTSQHRWAVLVGMLLGCSLLTRVATLIVLPLFALYLIFPARGNKASPSHSVTCLALFVLPLVIAAITIGWYNTVRFGIFYEDGHAGDTAVRFLTPLLVGLVGQVLSPGKGLLLYSPVLFFAVFGFKKLYRTHSPEALFFGGVILVNLLFYSKLANWSGDWCWGPRFTVPIVPFISLFLGAFVSGGEVRKRAGLKRAWAILLLLSLIVQIGGVTINGPRRIGHRYVSDGVTPSHVYWHPAQSPLVDHARLLVRLSVPASHPSEGESVDAWRMSYEDTTADFWFVYLYSLGFPLRWIVLPVGILIVLHVYFGFFLVRAMIGRTEEEC